LLEESSRIFFDVFWLFLTVDTKTGAYSGLFISNIIHIYVYIFFLFKYIENNITVGVHYEFYN